MKIRVPMAADSGAIDAIVAAAFGREEEARIARDLRAEALVLELIAVEDEPIGHVMFSRDWIETDGARYPAVQLGPVAVAPARQKSGAGGAMIRDGLARLRAAGETHVFVLGHVTYYPRFGFSPEAAQTFQSPWPRPSFMLARIAPGGPEGGALIVPKAFG
jgi:putative acetyltransferase